MRRRAWSSHPRRIAAIARKSPSRSEQRWPWDRRKFGVPEPAIDHDGKLIVGADLAAQTKQAMRNLQVALAAAGATFADVVKTTTFVVGFQPAHREIITGAKDSFYRGRKPRRALCSASAL
jgi:enamine deaminase RidA (YjgF/YER057c/UK114 family)